MFAPQHGASLQHQVGAQQAAERIQASQHRPGTVLGPAGGLANLHAGQESAPGAFPGPLQGLLGSQERLAGLCAALGGRGPDKITAAQVNPKTLNPKP